MPSKEKAKKKHRLCLKRVFTGLFMFTSGIAIWCNIIPNKLIEALHPDWQPIVHAIASSILILWIFAGFWLSIYGLSTPCPKPLEY